MAAARADIVVTEKKMIERNLTALRVIVSCDDSPLGAQAMDTAAALARRLDAELKGVFIEDVNLIRSADLPFTHEVTWSGASPRRMQSNEVQRTLQRQAQALQTLVVQTASARRLRWSFEVVRGASTDRVLDAMQALDVVVFGHAGRYSASLSAPLQTIDSARRAMLVVFDGTPASHRALNAALDLVRDTRSRLVIAVTSGDSDPALLRARARRQLESRREQATVHTQTLFVTLKHRDAATVARVTETYAPHLLLWGGIACDTDRAALTALVDMLRCPVVLVA